MNTNKRYVLLDPLRVILALYVFIFHAVGLIQGWNNDHTSTLSYWARFGYLSVDAFFVISGFAIVVSTKENKDWQIFLTKRLKRLIPGFIFVWTLESIIYVCIMGRNGLSNSKNIVNTFSYLLPTDFRDSELRNFVAWSLAIEVTFYFIFLVYLASNKRFFATSNIGVFHITLFWLGLQYVAQFNLSQVPRFLSLGGFSGFFILGMALALFKDLKTKRESFLVLFFVTPLLFKQINSRCLSVGGIDIKYSHTLLIYSILILSVVLATLLPQPGRNRLLEKLGRSSYVMYLMGGSVGMFLLQKLTRTYPLEISILILLLFIVTISLIFEVILQKTIEKLLFGRQSNS
jgi:peptidoglycan/LPS O-acetylase OafA/YrhL